MAAASMIASQRSQVDTYQGASGEKNARTFGVLGYSFTATKPA